MLTDAGDLDLTASRGPVVRLRRPKARANPIGVVKCCQGGGLNFVENRLRSGDCAPGWPGSIRPGLPGVAGSRDPGRGLRGGTGTGRGVGDVHPSGLSRDREQPRQPQDDHPGDGMHPGGQDARYREMTGSCGSRAGSRRTGLSRRMRRMCFCRRVRRHCRNATATSALMSRTARTMGTAGPRFRLGVRVRPPPAFVDGPGHRYFPRRAALSELPATLPYLSWGW